MSDAVYDIFPHFMVNIETSGCHKFDLLKSSLIQQIILSSTQIAGTSSVVAESIFGLIQWTTEAGSVLK